jgi:hypothetical protein
MEIFRVTSIQDSEFLEKNKEISRKILIFIREEIFIHDGKMTAIQTPESYTTRHNDSSSRIHGKIEFSVPSSQDLIFEKRGKKLSYTQTLEILVETKYSKAIC